MDNKFVEILKEVIKHYGHDVCDNCNLLKSLIADYAKGEFYKERKLLIWILETNYHKTITLEYEFGEWKQEHIIKLNREEFIDKEAAGQILDVIFKVLFGEPYYIKRGFKLLENNSPQKAEIAFNKAIELVPNSSMAYQGKGIIALGKGDYDNAIKYFSATIRYNPESTKDVNIQLAEAYGKRGNEYVKQRNYKLAILDYKQAVICNQNIHYLENLAKSYHAISDYSNEAACYTKIIDIEPENISFIMYRSELYLQLEEYQKAIDGYNEVLNNNKLLISAYEKRSFAYFKLKKYSIALKDCQAILAIDQQNVSAFYHSSILLLEMANFSEARENLDNAIRSDCANKLTEKTISLNRKINFKESGYYEKSGDDYLLKNRPYNAINAFSKSIELLPNCCRLYLKRGNIYNEKSDIQPARNDYQSVIKLTTEPLEKIIASGFLYLIDKDYTAAIINFLNA